MSQALASPVVRPGGLYGAGQVPVGGNNSPGPAAAASRPSLSTPQDGPPTSHQREPLPPTHRLWRRQRAAAAMAGLQALPGAGPAGTTGLPAMPPASVDTISPFSASPSSKTSEWAVGPPRSSSSASRRDLTRLLVRAGLKAKFRLAIVAPAVSTDIWRYPEERELFAATPSRAPPPAGAPPAGRTPCHHRRALRRQRRSGEGPTRPARRRARA